MTLTGAQRSRLIDGLVVAAGVGLLSITFRQYRLYSTPTLSTISQTLSETEARLQATTTKSHLEAHPEDFNAWSRLAIAYFNLGPSSFAEGLNALDKARSLGATSAALFYYAGVMYDQLGLVDYAVNELEKFNRHQPGHYETQVRLGNLYVRQKNFEKAEAAYAQLMGGHPKDPTLWFNFAVICKERGQYDQALAALERLQGLLGHLPEGGEFQRGDILRLRGDEEGSIASYKSELVNFPRFLPALQALESLARKRNQWQEAREYKKRISEVKQTAPAAP